MGNTLESLNCGCGAFPWEKYLVHDYLRDNTLESLKLLNCGYGASPWEKYLVHDYLWDDDKRKLVLTVNTEFVDIIKEIIIENPSRVHLCNGFFYAPNSETGKYNIVPNSGISYTTRDNVLLYSVSMDTNIYIVIDNLTTGTAYPYKQSMMFGEYFRVKVNISWVISKDTTRTDIIFSI